MWRPKAEVVCKVETARVGIACCGFVLMILAALTMGASIMDVTEHENVVTDPSMTTNVNLDEEYELHQGKTVLLVALWICLGIIAISILVEIYLTQMLRRACEPDLDVTTALKKATRWRNVRLFLLIFYPISCFYYSQQTGIMLITLCVLIWQIYAIFVVNKFIDELKQNSDANNYVADCVVRG